MNETTQVPLNDRTNRLRLVWEADRATVLPVADYGAVLCRDGLGPQPSPTQCRLMLRACLMRAIKAGDAYLAALDSEVRRALAALEAHDAPVSARADIAERRAGLSRLRTDVALALNTMSREEARLALDEVVPPTEIPAPRVTPVIP